MPGLNHKNLILLEQVAFWIFIYLFVFDYYYKEDNIWEALAYTLFEILTYVLIVYINLILLIPLVAKGHKWAYLIGVIILVCMYILSIRSTGLEDHFYEYAGWRNNLSMVLNVSLFLLVSSLYWYFKQYQKKREEQLILKSEKLAFEVDFLRSQISPHFIFNSLNNIYAMALEKHENTAPTISKLSQIMRYVLYERKDGKTTLEKEINAIRSYIDLQIYRQPVSQNIDFYFEGNPGLWQIMAMILINLVENAFKHSNVHQNKEGWIKISSEIYKDGFFTFIIENSFSQTNINKTEGGLGLHQVKRQLEINYPDNHRIEISNHHNIFKVALTIQLSRE